MESVMDLSVNFDKLVQQSPIPNHSLTNYLREMRKVSSGALVTSKLLAGKIQSSSESQALKAFDFLEAALDLETEGSIEFRTEVGRYRFLNEIIRILSPKFLANQIPEPVKERAVKFITDAAGAKRRKWFPSEHSKIDAVYNSLVEGGVIQEGAADHDPDAEFQKSIFERGENAILLKKLLQSKNPNDLQAANRLIKNLVEEEAKRNERRAELHSLIDQIDTTTTLLREILSQPTIDSEIVEDLTSSCRSLRNRLGSTGTETNEETNALVQASENIESILELYESKKGQISNAVLASEEIQKPDPSAKPTFSLADELLISLDLEQLEKPKSHGGGEPGDLLNFGQDILTSSNSNSSQLNDLGVGSNTATAGAKVPTHFDDLDKISRSLLEQNLVGTESTETKKTESKLTLSQLIQNRNKQQRESESELAFAYMPQKVKNHVSSISAFDLDFLEKGASSKSTATATFTTQIQEISTTSQSQPKPFISEDEHLLVIHTHTDSNDSENEKESKILNSNPIQIQADNNEEYSKFSLDSIKSLDIESIEPIDELPLSIILNDSPTIELTIIPGQIPKYPQNIRGIIVTLTNRNPTLLLSDYSFQLLAPKGTQVKLFPPSSKILEPWKRKFLPPQYLTQGGLISLPNSTGGKGGIKLKLILTYYLGDDAILHNSEFELK